MASAGRAGRLRLGARPTARRAQRCDSSGLGTRALRAIAVDADFRIDVGALQRGHRRRPRRGRDGRSASSAPRARSTPARSTTSPPSPSLAASERISGCTSTARSARWPRCTPALRPRLAGIERADSLAFDLHKWMYVPYDAGCVLVRRGDLHRAAFATTPLPAPRRARARRRRALVLRLRPGAVARLSRAEGLVRAQGARRPAARGVIGPTAARPSYLAARVSAEPQLGAPGAGRAQHRLLPASARGLAAAVDRSPERRLVADLQESGVAVPSTAGSAGGPRSASTSPTTARRQSDLDVLIEAVLRCGEPRRSGAGDQRPRRLGTVTPGWRDAIASSSWARFPRRSSSY